MKDGRRRWATAAMLSAVLLLSGCAMDGSQATQASSAELHEDQVVWAFTQEDQHPELQLKAIIDGAKRTLDIAIYSLTYPDIVQSIRDAAKRGVKVRIITDRIQANGKTQQEALKLLSNAGIPLKINSHSGLMHLKMTVADGEVATTGSFNYSKAASTTNDEVFMAFRDADIAQSFEKQFEAMWSDTERFETLRTGIAQPEANSKAESEDEAEPAEETDSDANSPASCPNPQIKGNINAKGDKIYHVPGSAQYDRTKPEMSFCTEGEAIASGFRKANN